MGFKEDLQAAKNGPKRTAEVPVELGGKLHKLRFTQMLGSEYAAETLKHPPADMSVPFQRDYGYDLHSLSRAVAVKSAVLVDGKAEVRLSDEEWADLFAVADGGVHEAIANTVFQLNEFASAKAVEAAKKVVDGYFSN